MIRIIWFIKLDYFRVMDQYLTPTEMAPKPLTSMLGEKTYNQRTFNGSTLYCIFSLCFFSFFLLANKISGGETSKREDKSESGAPQDHVAAGATTNGKCFECICTYCFWMQFKYRL